MMTTTTSFAFRQTKDGCIWAHTYANVFSTTTTTTAH